MPSSDPVGDWAAGRPGAATRGCRRPRTVLYLHSPGSEEADRRLEALATGLDPSRYRPLVVLPAPGELGARLEAQGVEIVPCRLVMLRGDRVRLRTLASAAFLARRNARELGDLARRRNVALVHAGTSLVFVGQRVARATGIPHVQDVRGPLGSAVRDRLLWPLLRRSLVRADSILAGSPALAARLSGAEDVEVIDTAAGPDPGWFHDLYDRLTATSSRPAWILRNRSMPVSHTTAPDLRVERFEATLGALGYAPLVRLPARLRDASRLALRAARERPQLVLSTTAVSAPSLTVVRAVRRGRVRIVADVMGLHSLELDQASAPGPTRPAMRRAWVALERWLIRGADAVVTVNDRHAALIRRRYRPDGVYTIRDAAEEELRAIPPAPRAALGIPEPAIAVGFVGSLVCGRLEPLLLAWDALAADEPPFALVIAGDGPDLETYRNRAAAAGERGRYVRFLGALPREQALAALRACDIAYSECWSEAGFPAKLFEYMALGMPIVTQETPQAHEVLDEETALFFRTPDELTERLRSLALDRAVRERLGRAAYERFLAAPHTAAARAEELTALLEGSRLARPARLRSSPSLVSVVVPVRNGEEHLGEQLDALAAQTYPGHWELVVVDNGCTDDSMGLVECRRDRLPTVRIVDARERRGLNHARNRGAEASAGDYLVFCDADDVVDPGWLAALVEAGRRADLVAGAIDHERLNDPVVRAWRPRGAETDLPVAHGFLPVISGGNCGVWADVARQVGWDESFRYGSTDAEFSWRVQLAGHTVAFEPRAVLRQRYRAGLAPMMGQYYRYGRSEPQLYRRFRRYGMRRPSGRDGLHAWKLLVRRTPDVLGTVERRGHWLRLLALRTGRLVGSVRWGVPFL